MNIEQILDFLVSSKRHTQTHLKNEKQKNPTITIYQKNDLIHEHKRYFLKSDELHDRFFGIEFVRDNSDEDPALCKILWSMTYQGRITKTASKILTCQDSQSIDAIENFQQQALISDPNPIRFRGPELYEDSPWLYLCQQKVDSTGFNIEEKIFYLDCAIYSCSYKGQHIKAP